jgi:chromosome segregation ATPase
LTQKQDFNRERLQEFERRKIEIEKETEFLNANLTELEEEAHSKSEELRASEVEYGKAEAAHRENQATYSLAEAAFDSKKGGVEGLRNLIFENASALAGLRNEMGSLRATIEANTRHRQRGFRALRVRGTERRPNHRVPVVRDLRRRNGHSGSTDGA